MKIIAEIEEMQKLSTDIRRVGKKVVLVPTMGYLHEGHASLMREGRKRADLLVASVFVNPTQFCAGEDFTSYPRDMSRDMEIATAAGVDVIFAPEVTTMYPPRCQTYIEVKELSLPLCGAGRPGHFRGVTTVVGKLFNIVWPHAAIFGKKDYQQLAVIRRMVADLNIPVEIIGMPIVREPDGLAMSSRNSYLTPGERDAALCIYRSICAAGTLYQEGELNPSTLRERVISIIGMEQMAMIEYVEFRDGVTLEKVNEADDQTLLAMAVRIGKTRLIDNCILGEKT